MKKSFSPKTQLDPTEKLKAAYLHEVMGIEMMAIAIVFGVNQGRVSEAITAIRKATGAKPTDGDGE